MHNLSEKVSRSKTKSISEPFRLCVQIGVVGPKFSLLKLNITSPTAPAEVWLVLKMWVAAKLPLRQPIYVAVVHLMAGSFISAHL